jgi:hypothetical protein
MASSREARIMTGITGVIMFFGAMAIWSGLLGVPTELKPYSITLDTELEKVRPWAPWWVMPSFSALAGMMIWRAIAQRRDGRVSMWGAALAYCVALCVSIVIASLCLKIGAVLQYVPAPSLLRFLSVLPALLGEGVGLTIVTLSWHGIVLVPAALIGVVTATVFRLMLRLVPKTVPAPVPAGH